MSGLVSTLTVFTLICLDLFYPALHFLGTPTTWHHIEAPDTYLGPFKFNNSWEYNL